MKVHFTINLPDYEIETERETDNLTVLWDEIRDEYPNMTSAVLVIAV